MSEPYMNLMADESDSGSYCYGSCESECGVVNTSECGNYEDKIQKVSLAGYNTGLSNKLSVLLEDLYAENNCKSINLAVVSNYTDVSLNESIFYEVKLDEIKIDYDCFVKIFFCGIRNGFSSQILGTIWKGIKNFPLASIVLEKYEEHYGIQIDKIPASKKINLYKQCTFSNLNTIIKKSYGLTEKEFNFALGSVYPNKDGDIFTDITINLYFPSLVIGLKIVMTFAVSCVPRYLIGKVCLDDPVCFNFNNGSGNNCSIPAEIIVDNMGVSTCDDCVDIS